MRERESLLARVRSAAEAYDEATAGTRPPAIGDLLVIPGTGDDGVEWALAERADDRVLLVPADHAPHDGDDDLRAAPAAGGGAALWLRCRWARRWPSRVLETARRSGVLASETMAEARARSGRAGVDAYPEPGPGSPGYRAWVERAVLPACRRLDELARPADVAGRVDPPAELRPRPAPAAVRAWLRAAAVAAMTLLAVGLLGWALSERQRAERAIAEQERLASELASVRPTPMPTVDAAASYAFLHPAGSLRGDEDEIEIDPAERGSVVLLVALTSPGLAGRDVALELHGGGGEPIWSGEGRVGDDHELRLAVPTRLLPAGRYRLSARPLDAGEGSEAGGVEYRFSVVERP